MNQRSLMIISWLGVMSFAPLCWAQNLVCLVDGSDDQFLLYNEQRILRSKHYEVYAMMGGMTLLTVARSSGRFHRITQLNLLPEPEPIQRFEGSCYNGASQPRYQQHDKRP